MNHKKIARYLMLALFALPVLGNAAEPEPSAASTYVKDSVITTKIKADLAGEKFSSLMHINVDTDKQGVVTLSGSAATLADIDKAISISHAVKGVTSVENHIKIVADQ